MAREPSALTRLIRGFGRFWWDFLVGDTPEVTVAVLLTLVAVSLVSDAWQVNALAWIMLPLLAVITLALSVWRALGRDERQS